MPQRLTNSREAARQLGNWWAARQLGSRRAAGQRGSRRAAGLRGSLKPQAARPGGSGRAARGSRWTLRVEVPQLGGRILHPPWVSGRTIKVTVHKLHPLESPVGGGGTD